MMEIEGLDEFIEALDNAANGGLAEEIGKWLDAMGMEFLDLIQDEIIRTETVDTRLLLNSFKRGDDNNIFSITEGGMTLDIGTNIEYAEYANSGRFQSKRFVPGYWDGNSFKYDRSSSSGMMLEAKFIAGTHYWDNALAIFEKIFERSLDKLLQKWLDAHF